MERGQMNEVLEPFKIFVNNELPKRFSTELDPLSVRAGLVPISTGIGLGLDLIDPTEFVKVGLFTDHKLPINPDGTVTLTRTPLGGTVLDMALIRLNDGSYLEVIGVKVVGNTLLFLPLDYLAIKDMVESVSVSYLCRTVLEE